MSLPNGLERLSVTELTNRHQNFTQPLTPGASFKLRIPTVSGSQAQYRQTTANFQWLIQHAISHNLRLRAIGKNWSFTKVGVTNGGLIDANALMQTFPLGNSMVAPAYLNAGHSAGDLFFTECGTTIHIIEEMLEANGKSMRASGASNGQTIAGAFSTGTHGAAFNLGAVHDTVVGLHLVTGADRHVWLERASFPVASPAFTDWLGVTDVLRDDDLFNAAVVSFGSFGFIHGVMLQTEPLFWLKAYSNDRVVYNDDLKRAMTQLDFSGLQTALRLPTQPDGGEPYHFQMIVNPHQFDVTGTNPAHGAFIRILNKHTVKPAGAVPPPPKPGFVYGDDTMGLIQTLLDKLRPFSARLVPAMVNALYPQALENTDGWVGTMADFFGYTNIRGKASSAAIGIDATDSPRVLEEIIELNKQSAFPGVLGLRWVRQTPATLGFTRFPVTCVLELDGIESTPTRQFLQKTWNRLETLGIPYTLHWGKVNFNLDAQRVRNMYGDASVDAWLLARNQLLDNDTRKVFTNEFMERCGLDKAIVLNEPIV